MANHYISKEMTDRLYATMKRKNVSTNQMCKELNIAYPDFKAMLEGRQPCFNKWQKKIANVLGVERDELFKEFTTKSLEQEPILDKIKQIVDRPIGNNAEEKAYNYMMIVKDIKEILDKYKAEMEKK